MTGVSAKRKSFGHYLLVCASIALALVCHARALAMVKISDGFGDADVNNNGTALEPADVDVSSAGHGTVGPYAALGNGGTPPVYPMDTMVPEVTAVENASDVGIRWYSISGFSGSGPILDPRASVHILSDAAGVLPETNPSIGYYHAATGGTSFAQAINSGLALAWESKGRGNAAAGFFNSPVALGTAVNDEVKVSFDFRLWFSAPNINTNTNINEIPAIGEIRFGMYQDTDHQLGLTNSVAGANNTPAVWGQANGNFRGDNGTVGAQNDHGWFVRLPIDDPANDSINPLAVEDVVRINEETNEGTADDQRIMNGATDFVAKPLPDTPDHPFPFLDINKVYNLSLSLKRFDDPATPGNTGDTIYATVTVTDRATGLQYSFGNFEPVTNGTPPTADGISSDSWDYFSMTTGGSSQSDDFDWLIDNFKVEVNGSNAVGGVPGDYNNNGVVDMADYVLWRNGGPLQNESESPGVVDAADYQFWRAHFGNTSGSGSSLGGSSVPEPASIVLVLFGGFLAAGSARRGMRN